MKDNNLYVVREIKLLTAFSKITCINFNVDDLPNSCSMMLMLKVELNLCFIVGTESTSKRCVFSRDAMSYFTRVFIV